jgi:hypothetical protein
MQNNGIKIKPVCSRGIQKVGGCKINIISVKESSIHGFCRHISHTSEATECTK